MSEVWKPVVGYEGIFEVSNEGRVRSLDRYVKISSNKRTDKEFFRFKKGRLLSIQIHNGYCIAGVGPNKTAVHRLVAKAFIPNPENKRAVNHINGIKTDNRVENLEWVTDSENMLHALRIGLRDPSNNGNQKGVNNVKAKLREEDIPEIREALARKELPRVIAERYGVTSCTIFRIKWNQGWTHI